MVDVVLSLLSQRRRLADLKVSSDMEGRDPFKRATHTRDVRLCSIQAIYLGQFESRGRLFHKLAFPLYRQI
ncbi:MAG: hypothetical protein ACI9MF_002447, partial [Gammaproteobacteria bacterium]